MSEENSKKTRTAVVLFNLGGPDSKESIRPFLVNFFTDANIIRLPYPLRWLIAQLIASRRTKREAGQSYGELGGSSPLLANSLAQADALEQVLNDANDGGVYKTFICMRYWHPMAQETVAQVKAWGADRVVLLPLYPQYSTTTTRSSYQEWTKAARAAGLSVPEKLVCCYPAQDGFVEASAANINHVYQQAASETGQKPRILFSAHGLPEKIVRDGDPYEYQCRLSAEKIVAATGIENPDWSICYQSRVGPQKWLGPSTEDALHKAARDKVPVVILPHAFTQEHVETLVEIEIEYREKAHELGVHGFYRVPTVSTHPAFIDGLAVMTRNAWNRPRVAPDTGARLCPKEHCACAMEQFSTLNPLPAGK